MFTDNQQILYMIYMIKRFGKILSVLCFIVSLFIVQSAAFSQDMRGYAFDNAAKSRVISKIGKMLNKDYIFLDKAHEMKKLVEDKLKAGGYDSVNDPMQFADILTSDLQSVSHDKHLRVRHDPQLFNRLIKPEDRPGDNDDNYWIDMMKRENYGFKKVEILNGNIGYIDFRNFAPADYSKEKVASVMNFISGTDAIIFDLRQNGGGSPDGVRLICSYLFGKEPVHLNDLYYRNEDKTEEFWTLRKVDGVKRPDVPVYVLTSPYTFSGAEEFTYNLKNLKRATIVGETTGGGANPGGMHPAKDGFVVFVPSGRAINPYTKTNWEGTGVSPDVSISSEKALEKAQILALTKISDSQNDEQAKKKYQWLIQSLEGVMNVKVIDQKTLESYAGSYGDRTITLEGSNLYYQRLGRPKMQMTPMSDDTFMFKDITYFRIKFEKDTNGKVTGLTGIYDDGHTDSSLRTN